MFHGGINHVLEPINYSTGGALKKVFELTDASIENLKRELAFYNYCAIKKINNVPRLINTGENYLVIEFIEGERISSVDRSNLIYFSDFLCRLNTPPSTHIFPFDAVEAIFEKGDLLNHLEKRKMKVKVNSDFYPKNFMSTYTNIIYKLQSSKQQLGSLIISPSDFGAHNSLKNNSGVFFIDFEYSGKDSLLKCILDFAFHPANGLGFNSIQLVAASFCNSLNIKEIKIEEITLRGFALWWVLRLLNNIATDEINKKLRKGVLKSNQVELYINGRLELINKFYEYASC